MTVREFGVLWDKIAYDKIDFLTDDQQDWLDGSVGIRGNFRWLIVTPETNMIWIKDEDGNFLWFRNILDVSVESEADRGLFGVSVTLTCLRPTEKTPKRYSLFATKRTIY